MALVTRCPQCSALFRVGAEQLASRGGMVRCGSCRHVFNAIGCLDYVDTDRTGGRDMPLVSPVTVPGGAPSLSFDHLADDGTVEAPAHIDPALLGAEQVGAAGRESVPEQEPEPDEAAADAGTEASEAPPAAPLEELAVDTATPQDAGEAEEPAAVEALPAGDGGEDLEAPAFLREPDPARGRAARWLLGAGCLLLAPTLCVLLVVQLRTTLLVRAPALRPAIAALCAPLSCTAQWPMRPDLLAVVSSELLAVPGTEALEFTAVIRNRADFPQALPAIELTLTDSLDHAVARRVFLPAEFGAPEAGTAGADNIAPGADLSVRLLFTLPGTPAVGFVAYPFYP